MSLWVLTLVCSFSFLSVVIGVTDYSNPEYWGCLPTKQDFCDIGFLPDNQILSDVDVIFIHPTTYFGAPNGSRNQPIDEAIENGFTQLTFGAQGSVFSGGGRVFAPFYEQANMSAFFDSVTGSKVILICFFYNLHS